MATRWLAYSVVFLSLLCGLAMWDSFAHWQQDAPRCDMSYSRPAFVPLPVPDSRLHAKYHLYLFRQGGIDPMDKLVGAPALFIPGHAGSYKQARSIAAEAADYFQALPASERRTGQASMDVFTVDLNEEFSALHGDLIRDQAEYLNDAIRRILALYAPPQGHEQHGHRATPSSVLVIGHSMGGIVARVMQHLPNYTPRSITTIFTLATPHRLPPIILEDKMHAIYHDMLQRHGENTTTALISIAGGSLDNIVNSDAALLPPSPATFSVIATGIPRVWTGCDHMAILWCNQVVKQVAAMLVDIIDIRLPAQTLPIDQRMALIRKRLDITRHVVLEKDAPANMSTTAAAMGQTVSWSWKTPLSYMYRLGEPHMDKNDQKDIVIVWRSSDEPSDSVRISLCRTSPLMKSSRECAQIQHDGFQPLPSSADMRAPPLTWILTISRELWRTYDQLVLEPSQRSHSQEMRAQVRVGTMDASREMNVPMAGHAQILRSSGTGVATVYQFPRVRHPFIAYRLNVDIHDPSPLVVQQQVGRDVKFHVLTPGSDGNVMDVDIHFHRVPSRVHGLEDDENDHLALTFWSTGANQDWNAKLAIDWYGSLGRCVLRFGPSVPMALFVIAMTLLMHNWCIRPSTTISKGVADIVSQWLVGASPLFCLVVAMVVIANPFTDRDVWHLSLAISIVVTFVALGAVVVISGVAHALTIVFSTLHLHLSSSLAAAVITVLLGTLQWLPTAVVLSAMYFVWIAVCAKAYKQASKMNDAPHWDVYWHRWTLLVFLKAWLLPFHVPHVVVFVRDMLISWHFQPSRATLVHDAPVLANMLILLALGFNGPWQRNKTMGIFCVVPVVYYAIYGGTHPFAIDHFFSRAIQLWIV
ncbi:PGAP1-like protein-domain-containing protein [Gongronella butleri]|nr:PGAP1-like protein-domain-containing protein [Gongronella butleri]